LTWKSCTAPSGHPDKMQWPPATFIAPARKGSSDEARVGHNYEPMLQMNMRISAFMITPWSRKCSGVWLNCPSHMAHMCLSLSSRLLIAAHAS
jgi:hypothetical protein